MAEPTSLAPSSVETDGSSETPILGPRELYLKWEERHWASSALDYAVDRAQWMALETDTREMILRGLAPFFVGEERIARAFAPILMSADDDQEAAFLATQQVDEAKHMQFFDTFWTTVVGANESCGDAALRDARQRCNDAFGELFDRRLAQAVDMLRLDPFDVAAKVEAVSIYHLLVEGTLALTGMHFLLDFVQRRSILPSFTAGLENVSHDEQRHVAWGTWYLRGRAREDDQYGGIIERTLMELLPVAAATLVDTGSAVCDGLDDCKFLDYSSAALNHFALDALARRLAIIGGATQEIHRFAASGAWRATRVL